MRRLRAPDGCPWDREQTPASLRPFVLEETYEVLEAIESGSPAHLCEELGDFLFEAVFLAQMSEEAGDFAIGDAIDAICDKLVRRHPHVFARGDGDAPLTSTQVIEKWETLKAREREAAGLPAKKQKTTLGGVPKTLPSLLRAYRDQFARGRCRVRLGESGRRARQDRRGGGGGSAGGRVGGDGPHVSRRGGDG